MRESDVIGAFLSRSWGTSPKLLTDGQGLFALYSTGWEQVARWAGARIETQLSRSRSYDRPGEDRRRFNRHGRLTLEAATRAGLLVAFRQRRVFRPRPGLVVGPTATPATAPPPDNAERVAQDRLRLKAGLERAVTVLDMHKLGDRPVVKRARAVLDASSQLQAELDAPAPTPAARPPIVAPRVTWVTVAEAQSDSGLAPVLSEWPSPVDDLDDLAF